MWRDSSTQMDTIEYDYRSTVQLFGTITIGFFLGGRNCHKRIGSLVKLVY